MKKVAVFLVGIFSGLLFFSFTTAGLAGGSFFIDDVTSFVGIGNTTPASRLDVAGAIYSRLVTASSTAINWNSGNVQTMTLSSSPTLTFSNGQAGGEYKLILNQDGTGSRTVTWPASVKWAGGNQPTLTSAANSIDMASFVFDGTNYLGSYTLDYKTHTAASIVFDATSSLSSGAWSAATTLNWSHAVGSGTDRCLLVGMYVDGSAVITGTPTYNGSNMTLLSSQNDSGAQGTVYLYYLAAPSTGSHTVSFTVNSSGNVAAAAASYTGCAQTGQPDSSNTPFLNSNSSSFSPSTTVVNTGTWLVGVVRGQDPITSISGGALRGGFSGGGVQLFDSDGTVSTGVQSVTINASGSHYPWEAAIISLNPAP